VRSSQEVFSGSIGVGMGVDVEVVIGVGAAQETMSRLRHRKEAKCFFTMKILSGSPGLVVGLGLELGHPY